MSSAQLDFVPNFQLYGEAQRGGLPDLIHVETLKDRSQHHDWIIRPHRHADLYQIIHFETTGVGIDLDGYVTHSKDPIILYIPPLVVHAFKFTPQVAGTVTTIPAEIIQSQVRDTSLHSRPLSIAGDNAAFDPLLTMLANLQEEYFRRGPERVFTVPALVRLCIAWVGRARAENTTETAPDGPRRNSDNRVKDFLELVEQNFALGWSTADYARAIGTSKSQLTRDCRALTGLSPLQVVHGRMLKEANRKLAYTPWPISQIAEALGFSDLGYFSRFYRSKAGETPSQYRRRIRSRSSLTDPAAPGTTSI